ncbi:outer membrane beta-barrel protein [Catenovulum agarivorans]|uniref:outer membrane beta-barrel protein n=1 Tax=Catenovulum agarivorans TaxID=1172192 RepID=UPI00036065E5|nr:outer membrane beta-barrel protein [Catenovulum agarivorans]
MNLSPKDNSAKSFVVGADKRITNRLSIKGEYSKLLGNDQQVFGGTRPEAIQIDGERFVGDPDTPLNVGYEFDIKTANLEVGIELVQTRFYTLKLSPGLSYFKFDLDTQVDNKVLNIVDSDFGLGTKVTHQFNLNEHFTVNLGVSVYRHLNSGDLLKAFQEIAYVVNDNWQVTLGYRLLDLEDSGSSNNDSCTPNNAARVCQDSEISFETTGFALAVQYSF